MKPVIFLAFANDRGGKSFLRNLPEELRNIRAALQSAEIANLCEVVERANVTIDEIIDVFQDKRYRNRIAIFHYGGHADGYQLLLESSKGSNQVAHGVGLVSFFATQENLQLIFFNGCTTERQTKELSEKGIPVVIGTRNEISDSVAMELAVRFYKGLGQQMTIGESWEDALAQIEMIIGSGDTNRGMLWEETPEDAIPGFPWEILFKDEYSKNWKIESVKNTTIAPMAQMNDLATFKTALTTLVDDGNYDEVFEKIETSGVKYEKAILNRLRQQIGFEGFNFDKMKRLKVIISGLKKNESSITVPPPVVEEIPDDPRQRILHFMAKGEVGKTIEAFNAYAKAENDSDLEMSLILQSGRYHAAKNRHNTGATSEDDMRRLEAQIMNALKSIYQDLD